MARNAESGYSTSCTPALASSSTVNSGVLPNSVMLASTGTFTARGELAVLVELVERLGEDHVGAGLDVALRALDRGLLALDGVRVGARHDHEVVVGAAVHRGLDAVHHLGRADQRLARAVAAALGLHLVLEVAARGTGADQVGDGARDVESRAPAGVGVDEQRQVARRGDAAHVLADVVQRGDAEVGQAERSVGDAGAREVDRAEAGALGEQRAERIDGADDLQRSLVGQGGAKPGACGGQSGHGQLFSQCNSGLWIIAQKTAGGPPPLVGASAGRSQHARLAQLVDDVARRLLGRGPTGVDA